MSSMPNRDSGTDFAFMSSYNDTADFETTNSLGQQQSPSIPPSKASSAAAPVLSTTSDDSSATMASQSRHSGGITYYDEDESTYYHGDYNDGDDDDDDDDDEDCEDVNGADNGAGRGLFFLADDESDRRKTNTIPIDHLIDNAIDGPIEYPIDNMRDCASTSSPSDGPIHIDRDRFDDEDIQMDGDDTTESADDDFVEQDAGSFASSLGAPACSKDGDDNSFTGRTTDSSSALTLSLSPQGQQRPEPTRLTSAMTPSRSTSISASHDDGSLTRSSNHSPSESSTLNSSDTCGSPNSVAQRSNSRSVHRSLTPREVLASESRSGPDKSPSFQIPMQHAVIDQQPAEVMADQSPRNSSYSNSTGQSTTFHNDRYFQPGSPNPHNSEPRVLDAASSHQSNSSMLEYSPSSSRRYSPTMQVDQADHREVINRAYFTPTRKQRSMKTRSIEDEREGDGLFLDNVDYYSNLDEASATSMSIVEFVSKKIAKSAFCRRFVPVTLDLPTTFDDEISNLDDRSARYGHRRKRKPLMSMKSSSSEESEGTRKKNGSYLAVQTSMFGRIIETEQLDHSRHNEFSLTNQTESERGRRRRDGSSNYMCLENVDYLSQVDVASGSHGLSTVNGSWRQDDAAMAFVEQDGSNGSNSSERRSTTSSVSCANNGAEETDDQHSRHSQYSWHPQRSRHSQRSRQSHHHHHHHVPVVTTVCSSQHNSTTNHDESDGTEYLPASMMNDLRVEVPQQPHVDSFSTMESVSEVSAEAMENATTTRSSSTRDSNRATKPPQKDEHQRTKKLSELSPDELKVSIDIMQQLLQESDQEERRRRVGAFGLPSARSKSREKHRNQNTRRRAELATSRLKQKMEEASTRGKTRSSNPQKAASSQNRPSRARSMEGDDRRRRASKESKRRRSRSRARTERNGHTETINSAANPNRNRRSNNQPKSSPHSSRDDADVNTNTEAHANNTKNDIDSERNNRHRSKRVELDPDQGLPDQVEVDIENPTLTLQEVNYMSSLSLARNNNNISPVQSQMSKAVARDAFALPKLGRSDGARHAGGGRNNAASSNRPHNNKGGHVAGDGFESDNCLEGIDLEDYDPNGRDQHPKGKLEAMKVQLEELRKKRCCPKFSWASSESRRIWETIQKGCVSCTNSMKLQWARMGQQPCMAKASERVQPCVQSTRQWCHASWEKHMSGRSNLEIGILMLIAASLFVLFILFIMFVKEG